MALEVYLVRHGKTVFNTTGRLQGWSDSPLTPEGRRVAERLGRGLAGRGIRFDAAFSSTAPRAAETARIILEHSGQSQLALTQLPDLREYCFGGFEGELSDRLYHFAAVAANLPDIESWLHAYRHADHHLLAETVSALDELQLAETESQFIGRLQAGMAEVAARSQNLGRVLVVSHGMAITALLKSIDFNIMEYRSLENASVSRLIHDNGGWRIEGIGDTSLLAAE